MGNDHAHQLPWYRDVGVLARRWDEFFPGSDMAPAEKLNALVRFIIYSAAALYMYGRVKVLPWAAVALAIVSFVYWKTPATAAFGSVEAGDAACHAPTRDNPFGNVLLTEYGTDRPPACPYEKDTVRALFNDGQVRNMTDVYERENGQRQFITMPVTTSIPDTKAFAEFAYGTGSTCKEDALKCDGYAPRVMPTMAQPDVSSLEL
jgi:hypothetical protein